MRIRPLLFVLVFVLLSGATPVHAALGIEPMQLTPEALDALVAKQIATDAELVRTAGLGAK